MHDKISFSSSNGTCVCGRSSFDKKATLRSLLSKASNYRKPSTISYGKCKLAIGPSIDACIESLKT